MKKRRELDALVSGAKGQKNGRHELLRNESESSEEVEEFAMPQKTVVRTRVRSQCCSTFATMCWIFLLAVCMVSIGVLSWMVIQLKNDVSELQSNLIKAEHAQMRIQQLSDTQMEMKEKLGQLTSVESGFPKLHANFSELNKKLMSLNSSVSQLVSQAASKPVAVDWPAKFKELQDKSQELFRTVADIGSSVEETKQQQSSMAQQLTDVRSDIAALQLTSISKSTSTTKPAVAESDHDSEVLQQHFQEELRKLTGDVTAVNETLCRKIQQLSDLIHMHNISVTSLSNISTLTSQRVTALERRPSSSGQLDEKAVVYLIGKEVQKYHNASSEDEIDPEAFRRYQLKVDALQSAETNRTSVFASLSLNISSASRGLESLSAIVAVNGKLLNETKSLLTARLQQVENDVNVLKSSPKQSTQQPLMPTSTVKEPTNQARPSDAVDATKATSESTTSSANGGRS